MILSAYTHSKGHRLMMVVHSDRFVRALLHGREDGVQGVTVHRLVGESCVDGREDRRKHRRHPVKIVHSAGVVQPEFIEEQGLKEICAIKTFYPLISPCITHRQIPVAKDRQRSGEDANHRSPIGLDEQIADGSHSHSPGQRRVLNVHHVQFVAVAH